MTRVRGLGPRQIFLPEFVVTLVRTPFLPPRYATFYVPLEFNKLDMRDYMKQVYNVDIISIRSYVEQQKVTRERRDGRPGNGPLRRPKSKKKMTIEMREPFVWPELSGDKSAWQPEQYYRYEEFTQDLQESNLPSASTKPKKDEPETIEQQAKNILDGKQPWKPTWQALGLRYDRPALAKLAQSSQPMASNQTRRSANSADLTIEDSQTTESPIKGKDA